jgi:leucyl/phenylalanyl-tRNA---protein transferase
MAASSSQPPGPPWLRDEPPLPRGEAGNPQSLSIDLLLWAYGHGIFPMADPDTGKIEWYWPDPRAVIPLSPPDAFHVSKNLAREVRRKRFEVRINTAFEQVMRGCAHDRDESNRNWISEEMVRAYTALHRGGFAHSVEAWREGVLVGGLYGVAIGGAFFGESMFSRPDLGGSNSSKVCLVHLVQRLREHGYVLLDTQFWNPYMQQFGCVEIPAAEYLARLHDAIRLPVRWND